jgi:hypothetical protein
MNAGVNGPMSQSLTQHHHLAVCIPISTLAALKPHVASRWERPAEITGQRAVVGRYVDASPQRQTGARTNDHRSPTKQSRPNAPTNDLVAGSSCRVHAQAARVRRRVFAAGQARLGDDTCRLAPERNMTDEMSHTAGSPGTQARQATRTGGLSLRPGARLSTWRRPPEDTNQRPTG